MTPKNTPAVDIVKIKYDYYRRIREKVEDLIGASGRAIKSYQDVYERDIARSRWEIGNKKELFKQIERSRLIYVGDFHAQAQSARSLLRVCRKLGSEHVCLALECFYIEHQAHINGFLTGNLSEREFLKKIEWKKNWGFPWEYTKPILKWASLNKVPVVALSRLNEKNMTRRDAIAARKIYEVTQKYHERKVVVQFGDFHLAEKHLPRTVRKQFTQERVSDVVVLQSPESLFFRVLKDVKDLSQVDFVRLSKNRWAIMSVLPWVKWQDYLLYLETGHDKKIKVEEYDLTDHVSQTVNILNKILSINVSVDELSVYSVNDEILYRKIQKLPASLRSYYKELLMSGQSFYCPEEKIGFVARISLNHISRVAALYVLFKIGVYKKTFFDVQKDFLKNIWLEMLTYFLVKIINPKKKTDTFDDIRQAIKTEQFADKGKEALILAVEQKLNEVRYATFHDGSLLTITKSKKYKNKKSYQTAAQILGGIMGEKVYTAYHKKILKLPQQKNILLKDMDGRYFNQSYYEAVELIDSWPSSFKSKFDKF